MVRIGVHVSIAGGIYKAVDRAAEKGCDVFQIFSRSPRGWRFNDLSTEDADRFAAKLKKSGIGPVFDHIPYLPNMASPKEEVYQQSVLNLTAELYRCGQLQIPYLVTHLGSHSGTGREKGLKRLVDAVSLAFSKTENDVMNDVILLLENTAGTKNSMGGSFEDIAAILDALDSDRLGICLDTCHLFGAGYELRTPEGIRGTLKEFDDKIGLKRLKLVHLNDSKGDLGSAMDRHEHIGLGKIGLDGFRSILQNKTFKSVPMVLETPIDSRRDDLENLRVTRELASF
jgi:deoxyribonuclease-4